jgi:hypothetical protein
MFASLVMVAALSVVGLVAPPIHCQFHEANQLVHRWEGGCGPAAVGETPSLTRYGLGT